MAQVDSENITAMPVERQVAHGLFELETPLLRVRDLVAAISMMASYMDKEEANALDAVADVILDELKEVLEERTRLTHLAAKVAEGGSDAEV